MPYKYFPIEFSSYEDYVKYLKEKGFALEAPEKIYIDDPTGEFNNHWNTYKNNDSVEYIRTDTVIHKAISYIQQHWIWNTKMIEGFKNYIKGE